MNKTTTLSQADAMLDLMGMMVPGVDVEQLTPGPDSLDGHVYRVTCCQEIAPGEFVELRFCVDDRDGPIPAIAAIKCRHAAVKLNLLAHRLGGLVSTNHWESESDT
ncbi:MAG: hypothetical protein WDZ51_16385 [Pirellulaceae bacterium]